LKAKRNIAESGTDKVASCSSLLDLNGTSLIGSFASFPLRRVSFLEESLCRPNQLDRYRRRVVYRRLALPVQMVVVNQLSTVCLLLTPRHCSVAARAEPEQRGGRSVDSSSCCAPIKQLAGRQRSGQVL